jgi:hypothetical protein
MNKPTDAGTNIGADPVDPERVVAESRRDFLKKAVFQLRMSMGCSQRKTST